MSSVGIKRSFCGIFGSINNNSRMASAPSLILRRRLTMDSHLNSNLNSINIINKLNINKKPLYLSHRFMHPASSAPPGSKQNDNPAMTHTGSMGQNMPSNENQPDYGSPNNEKNLKNVPSGYNMSTDTPHPDPNTNKLSSKPPKMSNNDNEKMKAQSQSSMGAGPGFGKFLVLAAIGVGGFVFYTTKIKSKGHEYTGVMTEIKEKGNRVMKEDNVKQTH